jgi:hypothetical protein
MGPKWALFFGKFVQTISELFEEKDLEIINNIIVTKLQKLSLGLHLVLTFDK